MTEAKLLGQFALFVALVLIAVALGKVIAGMVQDKAPPAVYAVLSGGSSRENPPLGEMLGS